MSIETFICQTQPLGTQAAVERARAERARMLGNAFAKAGKAVGDVVRSSARKLVAAQRRRAAAAQLLAMDDRMLQDIGLSRAEVPLVVRGITALETGDYMVTPTAGSAVVEANDNHGSRAA